VAGLAIKGRDKGKGYEEESFRGLPSGEQKKNQRCLPNTISKEEELSLSLGSGGKGGSKRPWPWTGVEATTLGAVPGREKGVGGGTLLCVGKSFATKLGRVRKGERGGVLDKIRRRASFRAREKRTRTRNNGRLTIPWQRSRDSRHHWGEDSYSVCPWNHGGTGGLRQRENGELLIWGVLVGGWEGSWGRGGVSGWAVEGGAWVAWLVWGGCCWGVWVVVVCKGGECVVGLCVGGGKLYKRAEIVLRD